MKQLTINVPDEKFAFIKELLGNFSFVNLEDDWFNDLSLEQKKSVEKGLKDLEAGRTFTHDEVRNQVKERIDLLRGR